MQHLLKCRNYATITVMLSCVLSGCESYEGVVRPAPRLNVLSPELQNLTDAAIEVYLKADVKPAFPAVLAVARLVPQGYGHYRYSRHGSTGASDLHLDVVRGREAEAWQGMVDVQTDDSRRPLAQVQFISRLLSEGRPNLKGLRDAAALLHAPLLLIYTQLDSHDEGYNSAAIGYWSIIGLFTIPGNTVGHHSVCQGLLIDTQSGFILATCMGEGKREENVLAGAVDIAADRTCNEARAEAVEQFQDNFRRTLLKLAQTRGIWPDPS